MLAVQLFVTLIEFKLTTLAGFVLVPFALWNKTAFLAERVLGNVVSSGIKVLVLAVIVGIGGDFWPIHAASGHGPDIGQCARTHAGSLGDFGLGIFGPGIATGLVSGAPQLGAGAAAGTALGVAGLALATGGAAAGAARVARAGVGAASSLASGARTAYSEGVAASGKSGAAGVRAGVPVRLAPVRARRPIEFSRSLSLRPLKSTQHPTVPKEVMTRPNGRNNCSVESALPEECRPRCKRFDRQITAARGRARRSTRR